jgi:hypothetical protein
LNIQLDLSQYYGLLAGALQLVAYLVYIRYFLKDTIRPNPASWLMFAYGTALMLFLEWQSGASWSLLVLPAVCALMSIVVALLCMNKGFIGPSDYFEKSAFGADLGLTLGYITLTNVKLTGPLMNTGFVVAGNLTTLTAFLPILRSTWKNPENEKAAPWIFWTVAYGLLVVSTVLSEGLSATALLLYPCLSFCLHGAIAVLALTTPKVERAFTDASEATYVGLSSIEGLGVFAGREFAVNDPICTLTGPHRFGPVAMETGPNWIGIGKSEWIDPDLPLDHINHSCEPNAAFSEGLILRAIRPIARDEEITMDYSTTEADLTWRMSCACGTPSCRRTLTSIQTAFADLDSPPQAVPAMQKIWYESQIQFEPLDQRISPDDQHQPTTEDV